MSITPPDDDHAGQISETSQDLREIGVSKDLEALLVRGIHANKLPKPLRGARAAEAMQQAFEIIGGVPRLALWADRNPDKFYPLFARMIPQTISPVVPTEGNKDETQTWPAWLTARRLAYQESSEVAQDVQTKEPQKINGLDPQS